VPTDYDALACLSALGSASAGCGGIVIPVQRQPYPWGALRAVDVIHQSADSGRAFAANREIDDLLRNSRRADRGWPSPVSTIPELGFFRSPRAEPHPTPGGKSRRARLRDFGQGHDSRAASADARHRARRRLGSLASLCSIGYQSGAKRANDSRATTAGLRPRTACFTGTAWTEKVSCPPSARTRNARPASISSRRPSLTCVHIVDETTWRRRNESELSCKSFGRPSWGASRVERNLQSPRR
jgi:hypothetical protein